MIVVELKSNFGKLARIPREVWRKPPARDAQRIAPYRFTPARVVRQQKPRALIALAFASQIVEAQSTHPALAEAVEQLRVKAVIGHRIAVEHRRCRARSVHEHTLIRETVPIGITQVSLLVPVERAKFIPA